MTLNAIAAIIAESKRVPLIDAHNVVEKLFSRLGQAHPDEDNYDIDLDEYMSRDPSQSYAGALMKLTSMIVDAEAFDGDETAFHNLAVAYAKANHFTYACDILDRGLEQFGDAVDLLADYLIYGIKCDRFDRCDVYYQTLNTIPQKRWNWRAFDFAIDYLIAKQSRQSLDIDKELLESLGDAFIHFYPAEDRAYLAKATIYSAVGKKKQAIKVLERATSPNSVAKRTPMCSLRLAKYYFETGEFEKALHLLEKAKNDNIEDQPSINRASLFVISSLCKYAKFSLEYTPNTEITPEKEILVNSAYLDFAISKKYESYETFGILSAYMEELQLITGLDNPYI